MKQLFSCKLCEICVSVYQFKVITSDTAHIIYDNASYSAIFNIRKHTLPVRSVKIGSRPSVIRIMTEIGKSLLGCKSLQHLFLVYDTVAVTAFLIKIIIV